MMLMLMMTVDEFVKMVMMMMKMKDSCHVDAARLSIYQGAGGGGELINGTNHLQ